MAAPPRRLCPGVRRRDRRRLQAPHGPLARARGPLRPHRPRAGRRNRRLCEEPRGASFRQAREGREGPRARPGLPDRLQGRRHRRVRQAPRPRRGLSHQASPRRRGDQARACPAGEQRPRQHHRYRKRHGKPRDRGGRLGVHLRAGARAPLHHRQRGRRLGLLGLRAREPRVSRPRRHRARRHELRPAPARPARRARQDPAPVHRRGSVSARP